MIIIAFTKKTSKILPRAICHNFRHTAPIIPTGGGLVMYQFNAPGRVTKIYMKPESINILRAHGWRFVYMGVTPPRAFTDNIHPPRAHATHRGYQTQKCKMQALSCVDLSKRALNLNAPFVQTPDALYRYLHH